MADAESIDRTLGRVLAILEYQNKEISKMQDGVAVIKDNSEISNKKWVETEMTVKALFEKYDDLEERQKKSEGILDEHEKLKNKGAGILAFLSFICGGIGWALSTFISKLWP